MSLDEDALQAVARGEPMEYEKWPGMFDPLLERLENIVYNAFPRPRVPPEPSYLNHLNHHQPTSYPSQDTTSSRTFSNKENTPPTDLRSQTQSFSPSSERVPDSQPQSTTTHTNDETLPQPLQLLFNSIRSTLKNYFTEGPPHTIQRLAELVLYPNEHYRTLPAYLRALDRIVSVTSSADNFPLHMQEANPIVNGGDSYMATDYGPGGDESMGGALLTPIPWLTAAPVEEDSGAQAIVSGQESHPIPSAETNAALQQEQQQQDTNTVVTPQESTAAHPTPTGSAVEHQQVTETTSPPPTDPSEEVPHARGPPVVGVEDMGLQNGRGVEMSLSAETASNVSTADVSDESRTQSGPSSREGETDGKGDVVLGDVTKNGEESQQQGTTEESIGKPEPEPESGLEPSGDQQQTATG